MKENMTINKILVEALLWIAFFSSSILACVISIDYTVFEAYMTLGAIDWILFLSVLVNFVIVWRLFYLHGIKSWRTFPIIIGFIMAWWPLFEMPVWIIVGMIGSFGG